LDLIAKLKNELCPKTNKFTSFFRTDIFVNTSGPCQQTKLLKKNEELIEVDNECLDVFA